MSRLDRPAVTGTLFFATAGDFFDALPERAPAGREADERTR